MTLRLLLLGFMRLLPARPPSLVLADGAATCPVPGVALEFTLQMSTRHSSLA